MTAADELIDKAELLGWSAGMVDGVVICYRGDITVHIFLSSSGVVTDAAKYRFFRLDDLRLLERASGRNKKQTVVAWLAED